MQKPLPGLSHFGEIKKSFVVASSASLFYKLLPGFSEKILLFSIALKLKVGTSKAMCPSVRVILSSFVFEKFQLFPKRD